MSESAFDKVVDLAGREVLRRAGLFSRVLRKRVEIDGRVLERESQLFLSIVAAAKRPPIYTQTPEAARAQYREFAKLVEGDPEPVPRQLDRTIEVKGGAIPIRVLWPTVSAEPLPALVYFHGGGFVIGGIDTDDALCRTLARLAGCVVVSVGYRLAPEHPFPTAVEDSEAAYRFLLAEAASLGIDSNRIAVGGSSAGGNLAAVLCQLARDAGIRKPCHQLLLYPLTDSTATTGSRETCAHGFFLDAPTIRWFNECYVGGPGRKDFRMSPLHRPDLTRLSPATVVTAGFDPLRDEGLLYARRLREAAVPVNEIAAESSIHNFALMPFLPEGKRTVEAAAASLRAAFEGASHA